MFLAKVDIAALMLHTFSAGMAGMLLVYAGVVGDGSTVAHLLSIVLFLVNVGTVLRVLGRGSVGGPDVCRRRRVRIKLLSTRTTARADPMAMPPS